MFGGRLVVVPYWVSRSPEAFTALLHRERVTVLNQTPSAFRQLMPRLLAAGSAEELTIRFVIFGGEALELKSLQPWFDHYGDERPRLINMYGITETTVHVTYRPITGADLDADIGSVIGKPIPDLRIYLLDQHRELVPIGVPGEMYVGGAGVARGYLQRPELTAERFITDPFSQTAGARAKLYRSGDLARRLPNGDLEYLGRLDDQVKIRGFRIELGEIEAVLGQHRAVRENVVIVREDIPGDKRLVAYVVAKDSSLTTFELRDFLKEKLPQHMVPSAFVLLDALPLTPNGKVDRRALPAPDQSGRKSEESFIAPRSPIEEILAQIWQKVLKLEKVGIHDNFFDLGGHSLLATQIVSRVRSGFSIELPLRDLFEAPTVYALAQRVQDHREKRNVTQEAKITRVAREQYRVQQTK